MGLRGSGHALRGLSMMKVSVTDGGIGSLATSPVPILLNTRSTSGKAAKVSSRVACIATAWPRLVPGMRSACTVMSPSSRLGTNSEPSRVASRPQASSSTAAPANTTARRRNAHASTGW